MCELSSPVEAYFINAHGDLMRSASGVIPACLAADTGTATNQKDNFDGAAQ